MIAPFVLQITAAVGLTAWLSLRNGRQAVNELARRLQAETATQIKTEVDDLLSTTRAVNDLTVDAIQRENLDLKQIRSAESIYWDYIQAFPTVCGIGLGNTQGDILALFQRPQNGDTLYFLEYSSAATQNRYVNLQLDDQRQVIRSNTINRRIDARQRPWYKAAIAAQGPVWTEVYTSVSAVEGHSLAINASQPIYAPNGQLQGVASVILDLGQVSQLLEAIEISPSGQVYIVDADGNLIGSSDGKNPVLTTPDGAQRLPATSSENPLIHISATYLENALGQRPHVLSQPTTLDFDWQGDRYYLQVTPITLGNQLQWGIVVVIPQADFLGQIQANTRHTLWLCLGALVLAIGSGVIMARWVTQPLLKLNQAAKSITQGALQSAPMDTHAIATNRTREVSELSQSFIQMTQQLQASFAALQTSEANYRNVAANVPGAIFRYVLYPDGSDRVLYMSPGCYELWEVEAHRVEQDASILWQMVVPEDLPGMQASLMESAQTLERWHCEWRITTPSGRRKWLQAIGQPTPQADKAVLWNTVILDVSDRKAAEEALKIQRDFNELIATITSRFVDLNPAYLDREIQQALHSICVVTGVDTSYVFQIDEATQTFSMTHEWCQPGYPRRISQAQTIPFSAFPWSIATLKQRHRIYASSLASLPEAAAIDAASWQQWNIAAVLVIPLIKQSTVSGFMGFASLSQPIMWTDEVIQLLEVLGQTIANAQESTLAQIALIESEARWQFALEGSGDGVWDWNAATNTVFFSRQWKAMLGYEEHEIGTDLEEWDSRIHPDDREQCYLDLNRHFTGETPIYQNEHRVRCKDNTYRWILDRGKVVEWNADGQPLRVIGTHTDITERKRAETQLQNLTNRLELAARSAKIGIWDWDIPKDRLIWDEHMYKLYGLDAHEFSEAFEAWQRSVHPDDSAMAQHAVEEALAGVRDFNCEFRIVWPDGTIRYIEAHAIVERDAHGTPLQMVGVNLDITDRKTAEIQLRDLSDRLGLAAQATNMGIWEWDIINGDLLWDERMMALYGLDPQHFGSTYTDWQRQVHPDDVSYVKTVEQQAFAGIREYNLEFRIILPNGTIRQIASFGLVQRNAEGTPVRIVGANLDISDRKQAEAQLIYSALHDDLTDLPNRSLFTDRVDLAIQKFQQSDDYHFAVLFLDLDQFKLINDSLGHLLGDQLLINAAHKLQSLIRSTDLAARLGGDEFVILLEHLPDLDTAIQITQSILAAFNGVSQIDGHSVFITTSIGVVWGTSEYTKAVELLRDADIALYQAKAQGRNTYAIFDVEMHTQTIKRMTLEHDLRVAIERQEFIPYYQPIVDLATRKIVGFEALIRWQHPTRGFVAPDEFIPIAEETGLITPISRWMLQAACAQMVSWQRECPDAEDLRISINLSGQDLRQANLVHIIQQTLEHTHLAATSLTLEITESMLVNNIEASITTLRQLRNLGIRISIDDFGTGYSSLSYLYNLPADYLKIDKSFVSHMQPDDKDYKIVQAVVALSDQLQIAAIAEGIETPQQLAWLQELHCELGQGYWLAPPLCAQAAQDQLSQGRIL